MTTHLLRNAHVATVAAGVTLLSLATAQSAEDDFGLPLELQTKVVAHVAPQRPSRTLQRVTVTQEIDHKTNFGKMYADSRAEFVVLEDGLIGSSSSTVFRSGKGGGNARGVSLCGFIPLLSESSSTSNTSTTTALPAGKLFIPFGIKS